MIFWCARKKFFCCFKVSVLYAGAEGTVDKEEKEMFGLFKKEEFKIVAPVNGELIPLAGVKDNVFSQKVMGDGFAVIPTDGTVSAPLSGTVESVFPTGHAVGISTKSGIECIVHIGLDTVELNGEGFRPMVGQGDKVKAGQPIVEFDKDLLEQKGYNITTIVVFPSGYEQAFDLGQRTVTSGETLI